MRSVSCAVCLLILPLASSAHHGPGQYDLGQTIALEGEIVSVVWADPHVRIAVRTDDGELWTLEGRAASRLEESGIDRGTFEKGSRVQLAGNPARGGRNVLLATHAQVDAGRPIALEPGRGPPVADGVPRRSDAAREGWADRGGSNLASSVALAISMIVCGTLLAGVLGVGVLGVRMLRRSAGAAV